MLTLVNLIVPARSPATRSSAGLTMRHGPHQGAQKSTSTGVGDRSTTCVKLSSPASTIHGNGRWHAAQAGAPEAEAGTRLRFRQCGQATIRGSTRAPQGPNVYTREDAGEPTGIPKS